MSVVFLRVANGVSLERSAHPLAACERVAWGELGDVPLIGFARDNALEALINQSLAASGARPRTLYEVASIATAAALAAQGLGVAILPSYARQLQLGELIRFRPLVIP